MAQWLACWAHNPKVRGSKPRSANFCDGAQGCERPTSAPGQLAGVLAVGIPMRPARLLLLASWVKALPDFVCQGPSRGPIFGTRALDH